MAILLLEDADVGKVVPISGALDYLVYGTDAVDTFEIAAGTKARIFGQSGVDVLHFLGDASAYTVRLNGTSAVFTHTASSAAVTVPISSGGDSLKFGTGTAVTLKSSGGVVTLGAQSVTTTDAAVTLTGGGASPATPITLSSQAAAFASVDNDVGTFLSQGNAALQSLLSGEKWSKISLTYSFNTSIPAEYAAVTSGSTPSGSLTSGWSALNETEKGVVRQALTKLVSLIPLTLTEVAGNAGDLRFNVIPTSGSTTGFAYYPSASWAIGGDVFLASSSRSKYTYTPGDHAVLVAVHEIGHAMGLKHPFETPNVLDTALDDYTHTTMSYTSGRSMLLDFTYSGGRVHVQGKYTANPSEYSLLDVAALQAIYGANTSYRTGTDTYSISYADRKYLTIWDAGGVDTLDGAAAIGTCTVDLRGGQFCSIDMRSIAEQQAETQAYYRSLGVTWADSWVAEVYADTTYTDNLYTGENNVAIAHGVWLENVTTGSAADTVRDNGVNNVITTGAGDDVIWLYEGGYDTVDGGSGSDIVRVSNTRTQVQSEKQSDGSYLVVGSYFAAKLIGVEKLAFTDGELVLA